MKEAMTGLGRALIILLVLLLIMNVVKLFMPKNDSGSGQEQIVDIGENEEKENERKKVIMIMHISMKNYMINIITLWFKNTLVKTSKISIIREKNLLKNSIYI